MESAETVWRLHGWIKLESGHTKTEIRSADVFGMKTVIGGIICSLPSSPPPSRRLRPLSSPFRTSLSDTEPRSSSPA